MPTVASSKPNDHDCNCKLTQLIQTDTDSLTTQDEIDELRFNCKALEFKGVPSCKDHSAFASLNEFDEESSSGEGSEKDLKSIDDGCVSVTCISDY